MSQLDERIFDSSGYFIMINGEQSRARIYEIMVECKYILVSLKLTIVCLYFLSASLPNKIASANAANKSVLPCFKAVKR